MPLSAQLDGHPLNAALLSEAESNALKSPSQDSLAMWLRSGVYVLFLIISIVLCRSTPAAAAEDGVRRGRTASRISSGILFTSVGFQCDKQERANLCLADSRMPRIRRAYASSSAGGWVRQERNEPQVEHGYLSRSGRRGPTAFSLARSVAAVAHAGHSGQGCY